MTGETQTYLTQQSRAELLGRNQPPRSNNRSARVPEERARTHTVRRHYRLSAIYRDIFSPSPWTPPEHLLLAGEAR